MCLYSNFIHYQTITHTFFDSRLILYAKCKPNPTISQLSFHFKHKNHIHFFFFSIKRMSNQHIKRFYAKKSHTFSENYNFLYAPSSKKGRIKKKPSF